MPLTSIDIAFGSLLSVVVALVVAQLVYRFSGFYTSAIDREIASSRFHAIDGLRGFLAIGVVLHHIYINHHFFLTGQWELTPSRFYHVSWSGLCRNVFHDHGLPFLGSNN